MSITFPKTWASGETLKAEDTRNNLDAMRNKQQGLGITDLELSSQWVDTHHIMQGRYTSTTNIVENVSGVFGGRSNGAFHNKQSYCSRWFSNRVSSATGQAIPIQYTNLTFNIIRPCTLFFQWSMVHQSPSDGDGTTGQTLLYVNDISIYAQPTHIAKEQPSGSAFDVLIDGTRVTNGILLTDIDKQKLQYSIGLVADSTAGKCQNVSWSVSLECFYL
tara:strand:+ start:141 stop:794 length:654 start_codon:yes stop_codon:yes gene_type:complete